LRSEDLEHLESIGGVYVSEPVVDVLG
jgi:hypothetical protein